MTGSAGEPLPRSTPESMPEIESMSDPRTNPKTATKLVSEPVDAVGTPVPIAYVEGVPMGSVPVSVPVFALDSISNTVPVTDPRGLQILFLPLFQSLFQSLSQSPFWSCSQCLLLVCFPFW